MAQEKYYCVEQNITINNPVKDCPDCEKKHSCAGLNLHNEQKKYFVTIEQLQNIIQLKRANKLTKAVLSKYINRPKEDISILFTRANKNSCFFVYRAV